MTPPLMGGGRGRVTFRANLNAVNYSIIPRAADFNGEAAPRSGAAEQSPRGGTNIHLIGPARPGWMCAKAQSSRGRGVEESPDSTRVHGLHSGVKRGEQPDHMLRVGHRV